PLTVPRTGARAAPNAALASNGTSIQRPPPRSLSERTPVNLFLATRRVCRTARLPRLVSPVVAPSGKNAPMPCALGVDVGTTNLKVALVRDDATVVGAAQRAVPIERGPDTATQDADAM